jgi:hypothetical protein
MPCQHEELKFGSGDYHIVCQKCYRTWAMMNLECTEPDSSRANQGFILYGDDRDFRYMKTEKGLGKAVKSILKILPQTKYTKMAP